MEALKISERYTYADYEKWDDDVRCELIDGVVFAMAAPTVRHQRVNGEIFVQLKNFLRGKACEVFISPFDVRLNYNEADDVVVQPDILVICDKSKIENGKHCCGAPDFVVEVLSPSNSEHDTMVKLGKYLKAGVREYWIVDPENKIVAAHRLLDKQYTTVAYDAQDTAPVMVLEGCSINLSEVFEE